MKHNGLFSYLLIVATFATTPNYVDAEPMSLAGERKASAIIVPVFSTNAGVSTLLQVTNSSRDQSTALKLQWHDTNGSVVFSSNAYLGPRQSLSVSLGSVGGISSLNSPSDACHLAESGGTVSSIEVPTEIGADAGYITMVEMGAFVANSPIDDSVRANDCAALALEWTEGAWGSEPNSNLVAPIGQLQAEVIAINVVRGAAFSVPTVGIAGFSDVAQHRSPSDFAPNLAGGHDSGATDGQIRIQLCTEDGCFIDTFDTSAEAVSALLMVHELEGYYLASPSLNAKTEWVITFPTRGLLTNEQMRFPGRFPLWLYARSGTLAQHAEPNGCVFPTLPPDITDFCFQPGSVNVDLPLAVNMLSATDRTEDLGNSLPTPILGVDHLAKFSLESLEAENSGTARLGFDTTHRPALVSKEGRNYYGYPAIGITLQQGENGTLSGEEGVLERATYGLSARMTAIPMFD